MLKGKIAPVTGSTSGIGLGIAEAMAAQGANLAIKLSAAFHTTRLALTAMQPTKKFVTVEEVAALAVFLAGDAAASITGNVLPIDGDWTAH